ncbi:MAG: hypothetical protein AB1782_04265 [Cyanobacteriota bacterium]
MKNIFFFLIIILISLICNPVFSEEEFNPFNDVQIIEITIPKDTVLKTRLVNEINSKINQPGDEIELKLIANFIIDEQIILKQNSTFYGTIVDIVKTSLLSDTYDIIAEINKLSIPFIGDYSISAHPEFMLKKHKKKKGHLFSFNKPNKYNSPAYSNNSELDIEIDNRNKTRNKNKNDSEEEPLLINAGAEVNVIFDKDFVINIKTHKDKEPQEQYLY